MIWYYIQQSSCHCRAKIIHWTQTGTSQLILMGKLRDVCYILEKRDCVMTRSCNRYHSGYGLGQWEMTLHWLSTYPEWSLCMWIIWLRLLSYPVIHWGLHTDVCDIGTRSSLVQLMACHLNQWWHINWIPRNKLVKPIPYDTYILCGIGETEWKYRYFFQENAFENVCKMSAFLFQPLCVKNSFLITCRCYLQERKKTWIRHQLAWLLVSWSREGRELLIYYRRYSRNTNYHKTSNIRCTNFKT